MSITVTWGFDKSTTITEFTVTKSTDKGISFSALATVAYDTSGANFDDATGLFFYEDGAGNPGDIYRITATGALGTSQARYAVAPPSPAPTCTVIGYVQDALGRVDTSVKVFVENWGTRGEKWAANPTGLVAHEPNALGIVRGDDVVYPSDGGVWQVTLVQGTYARIRIPDLDFDWVFEVPAETGPKNIRDIPQKRGASFYGIYPEEMGAPEKITRG